MILKVIYNFVIKKDNVMRACYSHLGLQELQDINSQYLKQPNIKVFQKYLQQGQISYFQIFNIINKNKYNHETYLSLKQKVLNLVQNSDNVRLLKAKVLQSIAHYQWLNCNLAEAKKLTEQALQILQESILPPLLPYYKIYCLYGLILIKNGQIEQAKEVLVQSAESITKFISQSEDKVGEANLLLAIACTELATRVDEKWHYLALHEWQKIDQQKYQQQNYARTIAHQILKLHQNDETKKARKLIQESKIYISPKFHKIIQDVASQVK